MCSRSSEYTFQLKKKKKRAEDPNVLDFLPPPSPLPLCVFSSPLTSFRDLSLL